MILENAFMFTILIYVALFYSGHSIPVRESAQWTMLLCKFRENPFTPHSKDWFEQWLTDESTNGTIASYFRQVSNGLYTIAESKVFGWFELRQSKQELFDLATADNRLKNYTDGNRRLYLKTKDACSDHARHVLHIDLPLAKRVITVVNDEDTAVFCKENGVLVAPRFMMTAAVAHEMVHSFFLGHSYSDVNTRVFSYSEPGEYGDGYDLMSTANAYMFSTAQFGSSGPGLNGPHLDYLGWLPADRIFYFGRDGDPSPIRNLRLSSLSRPHRQTSDWLQILLPYDREDPQKVYTVELRTKEHLDIGIPKAAVVVHQIWRKGNGFLYSKVLNQGGPKPDYELESGAEWLVFLDRQFGYRYIRLRVDSIDELSATARVTIHNSFEPTLCKKTEMRRLAFQNDLQCVTAAERQEAQAQNAKREERRSETGRCLPGFVPREAGNGDDVCVTVEERDVVRRQNERWAQYRDFFFRPTFGLNACKPGFLWRQIDPYDYVCVEPSSKQEAKKQDVGDKIKRATLLSDCFKQFVIRRAFPTDDICVTPQERAAVVEDNSKKLERLLYAKFFNGEDKIE